MISTIVQLGHELQMSVIAEGVETMEQLHMLQRVGCNSVQGFLLGRPAGAQAFAENLESAWNQDAIKAYASPGKQSELLSAAL